jgi:hypothetical protein
MTNKQMVLSLYPKAECVVTYRGSKLMPPRYYLKNGDSFISNMLYNSPKEAWTKVGKQIKQTVLEKFSR